MAKKHESHFTLLVIRKMWIKSIMRFDYKHTKISSTEKVDTSMFK